LITEGEITTLTNLAELETSASGEFIRKTDSTTFENSSAGITEIVSKTAAYTATLADHVITCDASSNAFAITLPAVATANRVIYHIKKTDSSSNVVTVDGNASETIDGATTATITTQFESIMIVCDGSNWHII